ncbi:MAG: immunoglobulin-like domain-containing protein [Patescibacteria group bacterium]
MNNDIRVRSRSNRSLPLIAGVALVSLVLSLFASLVPFTVSAATVTLFSDGFESGSFSAWTPVVDDDWSVTSGSGHAGSKKAQVADQGSSDDILQKNVSTMGSSSLVLTYYYKAAQAIESSDHVYVEWWNGSSWQSLADLNNLPSGGWTLGSHNLPAGAENLSGFKFRFRAQGLEHASGSGDHDEFQLDDVSLVSNASSNAAPVAQTKTVVTNEDTATSTAVLATDTDVPAQTLTYSVVTNPTHGTLSGFPNTNGAFTYTPALNYAGADSFTFKANDGIANSNIATVSITVNPVNDLPVITLIGANPQSVNFGDVYPELGAKANDVEDGANITVTNITGTVNTSLVGSYTMTYNFTDTNGGVATAVTRTVVVSDINAPVVTVTPATQTIEATGPTGAPASYTVSAIDDVDGDISGSATCSIASGATFPLGVTTINCSATDSSLLVGSGSATVTVVDTTVPVITLTGSATVTLTVGGTYTEDGATASDIVDPAVVVVIGGDVVDANTVGTYVVTYNATDASGNVAVQVTRTVNVVAAPVPVENTQALCSDGIDNDGDTAIDLADSDCAAFVPAPVVTPPSNGGGNGGGGSGGGVVSGPLSIGFVNTNPTNGGQVLGASTEALPAGCELYLKSYLKMGAKNDAGEVKKLQSFLNTFMNAGLPVTGVFGPMTFKAVQNFQLKHWDEVLAPWVSFGLTSDHSATGYVYKTTKRMVNLVYCAGAIEIPKPQLP